MSTIHKETTKGYKTFLKPVNFWQKSNRTGAVAEDDHEKVSKKTLYLSLTTPTLRFSKKSEKAAPTDCCVALRETRKGEIYKLSIVSDSGVYMPPSPCENNKEHWLDVDQDALAFRLPEPDRLTTHSGQHELFTPSATFFNTVTFRESLSETPSLSISSHSGMSDAEYHP